ncbi:hypothetical protein DsansV1_C01g0001841 [Dioscorea sansibarensis]
MDWIGYGAKQRSKRGGSGVGRKGIVASVDRASGEGKGRFRQRIYASNMPDDSNYDDAFPVQENSFAQTVRQSSYRRAGGTPIRTLIDEEISKETEIRRHSPGLVARLMGLDTLPAHGVQKKHNVMDTRPPHESFRSFQDKFVSFEDHSARKTADEHEDIKDVYEIAGTSNSEKQKNQSIRRGISYSRRSDIRYVEAKHLSTAEMLQKQHEFDDMLEMSDLNRDPFLKFLQEPNSLFSKHIQDLKGAPPPHASHITILKSSRARDAKHGEVCLQSERSGRRRPRMRVDDIAYFSKPAIRYDSSLKEHKSPLAHMLSKSDYGVEADGCRHPTQIVVLKPRLSKAHKAARTANLPRYEADFQFDYKWREETLMKVIREVHAKGRAVRKSLDDMEFMSHSVQGSRDVAREIMEQMKQSINYGTQMKRKKKGTVRSRVNTEEFQCTLNDNSSCSSSYSTKRSTSISREDKKGLSEKWKMTKQSPEMGLIDKASGTLGEMLALSVMETPNALLNNIASKKDERLAKSGVISRQGFSYGFCDNDAWEERCTRKLQRSVSAPTSSGTRCKDADMLNLRDDDFILEPIDQMGSLSRRSFRCQRNRAAQFDVCGEENILPEREIHVNLEELKNMAYKSHYPNKGMNSEPSEDDTRHLVHDSPVPEKRTSSHVAREQLNKTDAYGYHQNDFMIKETSGLRVEQPVSSHFHSIESRSSSGSKESEQPSPVSVLDPTSEEENSISGCFERVCADLKELRRQLRRLKLESLDIDSEQSELIVSDDDDDDAAVRGDHYTTNAGEILQSFKDEADRDFSYLLDVLIDLGIHGTGPDMLSDPFLKVEYPVQLNVFDNLEKKYSFLVSWPKSERRHLFDLINSALAEIGAAYRNLHPWMTQMRAFRPILSRDDLVEKVWQMVVKNRKELTGNLESFLELKWLNLEEEEVDMIGMDIQETLQEDLLEDLISEFMLEYVQRPFLFTTALN